MHTEVKPSACGTPPVPPETLQAARITARINVSMAVADVLAGHAYGGERRDHVAALAGLVAERTAAAGAVGL